MAFWTGLFSDENAAALRRAEPIVAKTAVFEEGLKALSSEALKAKTIEFKERLAKGETLDALAPEAFAVVRETSRRVLDQRHFDVQLIGGMILHNG
nr:preprotein translocase subunit SecA [Candidatus Paceibacterota bacterium]